MKKLLSTIMALVMLLSLVPMAVATEGATPTAANDVAQIGNQYYATLDDAVSQAVDGATIKLLRNAEGAGLWLAAEDAKSITIDFNDFTYTVTTLVGSTDSENQAAHFEKGNTVTMKNGTLKVADSAASSAKILIQNYCALTVSNMTLDGSNLKLAGQESVTLSNNGNTSYFENCVVIAAERNDVRSIAVDSSVWGNYKDTDVTLKGCTVYGDLDIAQYELNENNKYYRVDGVAKNEKGQPCITVIGGAYTDLGDAVMYAADNTTITLAENVTLDKAISIGSSEGKTIVLDLGGKTLKGNIDFYAGNLTIQNGTIDGRVYANATNADMEYGHLTIAKDAVIKGGFDRNGNSNAVLLWQAEVSENNYGATVDIYGTLEKNLWVIGNIKTDLTTAENPCVVNIHEGAVIKGEDGTGVAVQGAAKVTVGKAAITGSTGIEVRAGELTVDGATVVGTAKPTTTTPNGNGTTTDGAGIAVAQHTTKLPIKVTINSGDISGYSALYQSNPQKNDAEFVEKVSVTVNGGTFKAINGGTVSVYSENNCVAVSGGTFSSNPSAFVADKSLEVSKDTADQYTVSKKTNAAETSEVKLPAASTEGTTEAKIDKGDIDTGKDLTVSSEVASVTINQKGVEAIGNNSDLTLTVKTVDQPNDANKAAYDEAIKGNDTASAIVVDIKLSAGSGNAFTQAVDGAYALVTVKYDASGKADKLKVFYLNGSVKQELTKVNDAANGAVNTFSYDDTNKEITMKLPHFSQYLITTTATTSGGNTSGGSSVIKTGAGSSAASTTQTVTTDLTPGSITKVTVDGKVVDAKYYTVSGSNVTFTAEFLKTLKNGSHTVTVENATKIAKGVFTVNNPTTAVQAPTTADAGIALYAGMAIASVMGTGVVFTSRKRKNH